MGKRLFALALAICLVLGCGVSALAANQFEIYVDETWVEDSQSILENGTTYAVPGPIVRAMYPDAESAWENGQMVIRAEGLTVTARPGDYYIVANGRYLYVPGKVYTHPESGETMVPVRVLARAMGAEVDYDQAGAYLTTGAGPIESGDTFYNATDLDLIARVIRHEAGNQSLQGKIAVGNVILHRVESPIFPATVKGVLYQKNQFTGATNCKATADTVIAAKLCMDGADMVPGAYWFNGVGRAFWASRNKSLLYTIDGHAFYG